MSILNTCISSIRWMSTIVTSAVLLIVLGYKIVILCILAVIPVFIIDVKNYNKQFEIYGGRLQKLRYFKVVAKRLSIGDFTLYINALQNLESSVREVLNAVSSIYNDNLYIDTLFEFLQEEEKEALKAPVTFPKQFKEIRFE